MNYIFLVLKLRLKKGKIRNCLIKCLLYVIKGFLLIYINVDMKSYIFMVMGKICKMNFETNIQKRIKNHLILMDIAIPFYSCWHRF